MLVNVLAMSIWISNFPSLLDAYLGSHRMFDSASFALKCHFFWYSVFLMRTGNIRVECWGTVCDSRLTWSPASAFLNAASIPVYKHSHQLVFHPNFVGDSSMEWFWKGNSQQGSSIVYVLPVTVWTISSWNSEAAPSWHNAPFGRTGQLLCFENNTLVTFAISFTYLFVSFNIGVP